MGLIAALQSIITTEKVRSRRRPIAGTAYQGPAAGHVQRGCAPNTKRRIVCNFDAEVFDRVVAAAARTDVSVSEMVRRLVARGLNRERHSEVEIMIPGTLLICGRCGGCLEILNEWLTAEWIDSHPDDYSCDACGTVLELATEIEEAA